MSIRLEPAEVLTFKRPLTRTSKELLTLHNPTDQDIAFKVKTTAPKLYCVRPNAGIVPAGEKLEVHVMLQPFKEEPALDQKCRDKFLVQTVAVVGELKSLASADLWAHVEVNAKGLIQQIKLRCQYQGGDEQQQPQPQSQEQPTSSPPRYEASVHSINASSVISDREVATNNIETDELTRLRQELDAYRNEVEALRCRAPDAVVETSIKQNGVPLPLAILVAIISFLVAYLYLRQ